MPRRGHRKSRLGCAECKRRHLKCDETQRFCVNCKTAGIKCSFEKDHSQLVIPQTHGGGGSVNGSLTSDIQRSMLSSTTSPLPPATSASPDFNFNSSLSARTEPISANPSDGTYTSVNLDHLELLFNFQTSTSKSFVTDTQVANDYMMTAIKCGLAHPFVMHEVLALSSLHLACVRPYRKDYYRRQSAQLQALAVAGFNEIMMKIHNDNCVALFVFSSMMGMHAFCETFTSFDEATEFNTMLDKFTKSLKLIQGILVVMDGFWEVLAQSELKEMMARGGYMHVEVAEGEECRPLREMLDGADLSEKSKTMYNNAVTELQQAFTAETLSNMSGRYTGMAFAWLVRMSEDFSNGLRERRPEALIILSYHAVLLHRKRSEWSVQGAGRLIILAIKAYLGSHWLRWLEWPLAVIGENQQSSTTTPSSATVFHCPTSV